MSVTNVIGPEAVYLDKGRCTISAVEPDQVEISCNSHRHIVCLSPPLYLSKSLATIHCFSAKIKPSLYFKKVF